MSKFEVSFKVDLSHIAPDAMAAAGDDVEALVEAAEETVRSMLISQARAFAKDELHKIRKDADMDRDVKALRMGEQLQKMMLTLMAEANLKATLLAQHVTVETELPFERRYAEAA